MHFTPFVSIIIPVYNGANFMREAIDSALSQTYDNVEVVVVNDGSTDNTEEIAQSYGDKIRYYKKENGGVATALNMAIEKSKGEYISWLSHDDVYYPDKLATQIEFLCTVSNREVIVYSDYEFIDQHGSLIGRAILDHNVLEKKPEYSLLRSLINGCTLLIPKKAFLDCGLFDVNLLCTQDYAKWYQMMMQYDFVHLPGVSVKSRQHERQGSKINDLLAQEGDDLWIRMIGDLTEHDKIRLEGSSSNFYSELAAYLKTTPYKKAFKFAQENKDHSLKKEKKLVIKIKEIKKRFLPRKIL